jgi:hypothetical protein
MSELSVTIRKLRRSIPAEKSPYHSNLPTNYILNGEKFFKKK